MSSIDVRPVKSDRDRKIFLEFPWQIYRDDPVWVPPILSDRAARIDPRRSPFLQRGEAEFFIAWKDDKAVGTICAGEDFPANKRRGLRECVFGFFEAVHDDEVFCALIAAVSEWARGRGLDTLFGPFDLDYENSYGVLIEGRDRPPAILCGHTPVYYQAFFEGYGFNKARGDNLAFEIPIVDESEERRKLGRLGDRMRRQGWIHVRGADLVNWRDEVDRVYRLINPALQHLPDHIGWEREALQSTMEPFRSIADPDLILFAEVDGEPVGWFPGLPNLNEALIHANGLRRPWDFLKLWWHMRKPKKCLAIKSVLVLPEYWQTGVAVLMFDEMAKRAAAKGYEWADLSLTSEDNPYTPELADRLGAKVYKRYRTYRLSL
ncbi:MAG: GNAT family N-acetyltransferase [Anaerolineales bacterium]|jgi:GNAT superfamily N-acetyltransferase